MAECFVRISETFGREIKTWIYNCTVSIVPNHTVERYRIPQCSC